jgi:hypothetical protein
MRPDTMKRNCEELLICLDEMELYLAQLPDKDKPWLYQSMHELRELKQIAKFESVRMTSEQIRHYVNISSKAAELLVALPIELESSDELED